MDYPTRKPTRLKNFDYSLPYTYFVTICTKNHNLILGSISVGQGLAPAVCALSEYGKIAEDELHGLELRYPHITIHKYVIMPNHIHILMSLNKAAGAIPALPYQISSAHISLSPPAGADRQAFRNRICSKLPSMIILFVTMQITETSGTISIPIPLSG